MIAFLLGLATSKAELVGSRSLRKKLSQSPLTFVLFTSRDCNECDRVLSDMDAISSQISDILFLTADCSTAPNPLVITAEETPKIAVFVKDKFLQFYNDEFAAHTVSSFRNLLENANAMEIHSDFELIRFMQTSEPANLVIGNPDLFDSAKALVTPLVGSVNIALIPNQTLAQKYGITDAKLTLPYEFHEEYTNDLSLENIRQLAKPVAQKITAEDKFENGETPYTLSVLIDDRNPLHRFRILPLIRSAIKPFDQKKLSVRTCDFFVCPSIITKNSLFNIDGPLVFLNKKSSSQSILYPNMEPTVEDLTEWLNMSIYNVKKTAKGRNNDLPQVYAHEFTNVVLNPNHDVILFMAHPAMEHYAEHRNTVLRIAKILKGIKTIKVMEYNPRTDLVAGLQMPKLDIPIISVWPADRTPAGSNIPMDQPLPAIFNAVVSTCKTKIDPKMFKQIQKALNKRD